MNSANNNLEALNKVWKEGALRDFIGRMLIYFDPLDLIVMGAPHDEYDSYIDKIVKLITAEDITVDQLSEAIFELYKSNNESLISLKKKSLRMAEDLVDLMKS